MESEADGNPEQLILDWPVNVTFAEEDFLTSKSNEDAVKWVDNWPNWQRGVDNFHCLIIYGPQGCGKTHLSHVWKKISCAKNISSAQLNENDFISDDHVNFIIEDVDEHLNSDIIATNLLHLYNWSKEKGGFLLLTAKNHPKQWLVELADLSSRLLASEIVKIKPPDDNLLKAVIIKQFSDRQMTVSKEVLGYLVSRTERSFAAVRKLVHDIDKLSLIEKKKITIPIVKRVLNKMDED